MSGISVCSHVGLTRREDPFSPDPSPSRLRSVVTPPTLSLGPLLSHVPSSLCPVRVLDAGPHWPSYTSNNHPLRPKVLLGPTSRSTSPDPRVVPTKTRETRPRDLSGDSGEPSPKRPHQVFSTSRVPPGTGVSSESYPNPTRNLLESSEFFPRTLTPFWFRELSVGIEGTRGGSDRHSYRVGSLVNVFLSLSFPSSLPSEVVSKDEEGTSVLDLPQDHVC